ncbi:MAG TPA: prepilin-type N-terminal cleavage/methylation domain-containing protein [Nitrospirota bacterium]|nr:prepilin-type N-terminal cleavage/methylation domain-containing protein [Nitrospirota bacterium]
MVSKRGIEENSGELRSGYSACGVTIPHSAFRIPNSKGFTLIELMIVLAVMGILITIAAPNLKVSLIRAREAVLKEDLFQMREAIDQYYADNGKYPATLVDLINTQDRTRSYLRDIPKDPFTGANDWITVAPEGEDAEGGVFDVHSASPLVAVDGTTYNSW